MCNLFMYWLLYYSTSPHSGPSGQCEMIEVPFCRHDLPYQLTSFPNPRYGTQQQATLASQVWLGIANTQCHPKLRGLVCSVYTPKCSNDGSVPLYVHLHISVFLILQLR